MPNTLKLTVIPTATFSEKLWKLYSLLHWCQLAFKILFYFWIMMIFIEYFDKFQNGVYQNHRKLTAKIEKEFGRDQIF